MIKVLLDGHRFNNEVRDVIKLFFPDLEIKIYEQNKDTVIAKAEPPVKSQPPENDRGIFIYTGMSACDEGTEIISRLIAGGRGNSLLSEPDGKYAKETKFPVKAEYPAKTPENKKQVKWELKRQLYFLLGQYTSKNQPWGLLTGIRPSRIVHEMLDKSAGYEEVKAYLTEYCRLSDTKAKLVWDAANAERRILEAASPDMVSLYIGIPFCASRCLYCSFISELVGRCGHLIGKYIETLKYELAGISRLLEGKALRLQSIYIGGGTPTSIGWFHLNELLGYIEKVFDLKSLQEYTLEAGRPDSIDQTMLDVVKESRVGRISINPQTMNDETLRLIGRNHTAADTERAFLLAREKGFSNINMDVIAGLPGEGIEQFIKTMEKISVLKPENLTIHTLSLKRGSKLNEEKDKFIPADISVVEAMVDTGCEYARRLGMHPYYLYRQKNILGNQENTGYCRPGTESIYNIQIMEERQTILAAGAGAVTKVHFKAENRLERAFNVKNAEQYIDRIDEMLERKRRLIDAAFLCK